MNKEDPRYIQFIEQRVDLLLKGEYGGVPSFGFIPRAYRGKDISLYLSEDNPIYLGRWFSNGDGHESIGLGDLVKMGYTIDDIKAIPVVYLFDGDKRIP